MPALLDNQLASPDSEKSTLSVKDIGEPREDGDSLKLTLRTLETTTEPATLNCEGHEANTAEEGTEKNYLGDATVTGTSEDESNNIPLTCSEDVQDLNKLTTTKLDRDESDSDVSSMTTGTPLTSCSEEDDLKPVQTLPVQDVMDVTIVYGNRDVLDLATTLTSESWSICPAVLPPMNLNMFWQNRAQYHRLGNYGTEKTNMVDCRYCGFQYILPK